MFKCDNEGLDRNAHLANLVLELNNVLERLFDIIHLAPHRVVGLEHHGQRRDTWRR
jgi:hypothetical protein